MRNLIRRLRRNDVANDTLWSFLQQVIMMITTFVSFWLLGNRLGPSGFGRYTGFYGIVGVTAGFAFLGTMLTLLQVIRRDGESPIEAMRSCLTLIMLQGATLGLIACVVARLVLRGIPLVTIVLLTGNELLLLPLVEYVATSVQATSSFVKAVRIRLVVPTTKMVLLVVLTVMDRVTLAAVAVAYLIGNGIVTFLLMRWMSMQDGMTVRPGRVKRTHFKGGFVYATGMFALGMQNDGDKTVLAANKFEYEGGLYAAAYRFVQFGLVPISALLGSSHNRFLEHDPKARNEHVRRTLHYAVPALAYSAVFGVAMWFSASFVTSFLSPKYAPSAQIMRYLIPLVPLRALAVFPINGLMGLGRTAARTVLLTISALVAFAAYIVLIPRYTWKGAVAGTIISESFMAISAWSLLLYYQHRHNRSLDRGEPSDTPGSSVPAEAIIAG
jgi:O-antigen/teichoic acid export membrane protein